MRNVWTIAKREFNMYFASPVAYAIGCGVLLVLGIFFYLGLMGAAQGFGGAPDLSQVLGIFVTLMLFLSPALTMRLVAEEQRTGTIELLLTAPVREWELVLGKWLAAFGFVVLLLLATVIYVLILSRLVTPGLDLGSLFATYLGVFLLVGALLAIGVFISTLFSNQIAAFFVIIGACLVLWIIDAPWQNATGTMATVMHQLALPTHIYDNFFSGVVDLIDITYFVAVTVLFLFLAARSVESRRWR
jgi:ABC-2 type transport system permease protein